MIGRRNSKFAFLFALKLSRHGLRKLPHPFPGGVPAAPAREPGESTAALAHRYALSMAGVDTVVLGVRNRAELRDCLAAEAKGPLAADSGGRSIPAGPAPQAS